MCRIVLLSVLYCCVFVTVGYSQDWELQKDDKGIKVYSRAVSNSNFKEMKTVGIFDARIEVIGFVLRDIKNGVKWMPDCEEIKILQNYGNDNYKIYMVQGFPWPADDRDVIFDVKTAINYNKGNVKITMQSTDYEKHKNDDFVRMKQLKASYHLEYIGRNKTRVTYYLWSVPGGTLPSSLVNSMSTDIPFETFIGLRTMTSNKAYIEQANGSTDRITIDKLLKDGMLKP